MILLDAIYINGGGGKILLQYLIGELEKKNFDIFYLIDERIKGQLCIQKSENVLYLKNYSFLKREKFYIENKEKFSTVLCFSNVPPNVKLKSKVYTYFHQFLFLELVGDYSLKKKALYWLKTKTINRLKGNTDYWVVQTNFMKDKISEKFLVEKSKIQVLPFYPPFKNNYPIASKERFSYFYPSNAENYKNHKILIDAFCKFYDTNKKGKLTLTIGQNSPEILALIQNQKKSGYPIHNLGYVERENLINIYQEAEYVIFPSLAESFGIGLVEAIENGCKIIGADLPYTFAVCKPSIVFDPQDKNSIINALSLSLQDHIPDSELIIKNHIDTLIKLLVKNEHSG